jgi:hypothetical protein
LSAYGGYNNFWFYHVHITIYSQIVEFYGQ